MLIGDADQLGTSANVELSEQVFDVEFHSVNRDGKLARNIFIAPALRQSLEHVELPFGEPETIGFWPLAQQEVLVEVVLEWNPGLNLGTCTG